MADEQLLNAIKMIVFEEMDAFFKTAHPNPTRRHCLSMATLLELAFCAVANDDPGYDHVSQCSRCYRAMRAMQELPEA